MLLERRENIFKDNIAYIEYHDFSTANTNDETRISAVTKIASVCYDNPKALGSKSLFNRLEAESKGLPSSSFEFIPMLFNYNDLEALVVLDSHGKYNITDTNMLKYGIKIEVDYVEYLLTNYRAVVYDFEKLDIDYRCIYNTSTYEQDIIKEYFKAFLMYIDMPTRSQIVRHRASPQELSRRYVSGKKTEFEFYITDKMKKVKSRFILVSDDNHSHSLDYTTQNLLDACVNHYFKALEDGVKAEDARRMIPQAAYTRLWMGFQKPQLDNFFKLRLDNHAQWEIRQIAENMKSMIG
jgi:thymidylate synthase (FAD)